MSVDTFPELTPPVLVVGTLAPGLGPKDVEKTITWRLEKYVSATPGVDHVESAVAQRPLDHLRVAEVGHGPQRGADARAAAGGVRHGRGAEVARRPAAVRPAVRPVERAGRAGRRLRRRALRARSSTTTRSTTSSRCSKASPASRAPRSTAGASGRSTSSSIRSRRRRAASPRNDVAAGRRAIERAPPVGRVHRARTSTPTSTRTPSRANVAAIGEAVINAPRRPTGAHPRRRARRGRRRARDAVRLRQRPGRRLPQRAARPRRQHARDRRRGQERSSPSLKDLPPGMEVTPIFDQSTFVRTAYHGLQEGDRAGAGAHRPRHPALLAERARHAHRLGGDPALVRHHAHRPLRRRADAQRVHARRAHARHGAPRRRRRRRARVDPSPPASAGMPMAEAALHGTNAVALPVLASTLTTMAVLLPVMLLAGLAKKLFAPLALTVAVAMIASYFVSHVRDAGRLPLLPARPRAATGLLEARRARHRPPRRRLRQDCCAATLPLRGLIIGGALVLVVGVGARRGAAAEHVLPRDRRVDGAHLRALRAGHLARRGAARMTDAMGKRLGAELPQGQRRCSCSPTSARRTTRARAMTSPNWGPHMGFIRLALADPEQRKLSQRRARRSARARSSTREFPGVEFLQAPGGLVASVFANGYIAPLVVEVRGDKLEALDEQARAVAEVARRCAGVRDVRSTLELRLPRGARRHRPREGRPGRRHARAPSARRRSRRRSATSTRRACGSTPDNGQSYYVVTYYDAQRGRRSAARSRRCRCASRDSGQAGHARRLQRRSAAPSGPIAIERNQLAARRARARAGRGARHRHRRRRPRARRSRATRAPPHVTLRLRRPGRAHAHDLRRPRPRARRSPSWSSS